MKKRHSDKIEIDDAVDALQPFYDPEDDGYPVILALDALAGVLGKRAGVEVEDDHGLGVLLEQLNAPSDLQVGVEKLYENAEGGAYGAGLSRKQAKAINNLVQDVVEPIVEFITSYRRPRARRPRASPPSAQKRPVAKRRKR